MMEAHAPRLGALRWVWISVLVLTIDQWSKAWIVEHFELFERHACWPMLDITRLHNRGAAFSFLGDASGWQFYLFVGLALLVSIGIVIWLLRQPSATLSWLTAGLSLILGGAIGNVIDRLSRGYVVDFIHVHWQDSWYFPAFNVADSAITAGAICLMVDAFFDWHRLRASGRAT
jgi:signal peptidase II